MIREPWKITRAMFLAAGEAERLLGHVRDAAVRARGRDWLPARLDQFIIEGLLFSGLRNSEFCRLRLADADIADGGPVFRVRGRGAEERTVHLPSSFGRLVEHWVGDVRPALLPDGISPQDGSQPLVLNERRRPYERTGLYRRVVRILTDAGLGDRASVQLLRHTYGYLAYLRTGGNLLFVQRQLGHAHPMVTSIYAQFVDESYAALADRVMGDDGAEPAYAATTRTAAASRVAVRDVASIEEEPSDDRDPDRLL